MFWTRRLDNDSTDVFVNRFSTLLLQYKVDNRLKHLQVNQIMSLSDCEPDFGYNFVKKTFDFTNIQYFT